MKDRGISDWQTKRLGDLLQLHYGKSLPVKNRVEGLIPVYGSNGIVGTHNKAIVDTPGVIVGRKGSAGQVHRSLGPFCPIDTTFYVTAEDAPETDLGFLFYLLRHIDLTRITGDVGVPGLNREMAYLEPVRFPTTLPEQKKIAHILSTVQRAIEAQERIIQTTTELKKALMQKLFTEGLRNEPQKQTEIGPIPKNWKVIKIKTVGTIITGSTPSTKNPDFYGGCYNLISPADLDKGKYVRSSHKKLTELGFEKCRAIPPESILVGCIGNIGKLGMIGDSYSTTNQQINSIIPKPGYNHHFLYYAILLCRPRLAQAASKVTVPILNKSNFENFQIGVPGPDEQNFIAKYLSAVDQKIEIAERKKDFFQDLFRSILHGVMIAKIRVDDI